MSKRQFKCHWGEGYVKTGTEIQPFGFFTTDLGYTGLDIAAIDALEIGDRYMMSGPFGIYPHTVTRQEDKPC